MKRFWFLAIALLLAGPAFAAPFVVSDPYTAPAVIPDYFKVTVDTASPVQSPAYEVPSTANVILHFDVGAVSVGQHNLKVSACKAASLWGPEACSAESPFVFTRPASAAPAAVTGIGLGAQ